jgi:hypothetical protein
MEVKDSNMCITYNQSKVAPSAAVSISIQAPDINWFVFKKLVAERPCMCSTLSAYSEYTALLYSMFDDIRDRLIGTPEAQVKSKVNTITCSVSGGCLVISYTTQSSLTAIRKSLGLAISRMAPHKVYPRYSKYMRMLGGTPKRDEFMNCAKRISAKLHPKVYVVAKAKITSEKLKALHSVVSKKTPDTSGIAAGTRPESEKNDRGHSDFLEIKVKGADLMFCADYLAANNTPFAAANNMLIVYAKKLPNLKDAAVKRYAEKHIKLKDKLKPALAYSATSSAALAYDDIVELVESNVTVASISSAIKKNLS